MALKKKAVLLKLPEGRYNGLVEVAKKKERTITSVVEEAIDTYLQVEKESTHRKEMFGTDFDVDKETDVL